MKTQRTNLTADGRDEWEQTDQYRDQVSKIVNEVTAQYAAQLSHERNWIKRLLIRFRLNRAIRKRIDELSSSRNLHALEILTL